MAYIWKLRFVCPTCWIVIPGLMIFSHLLRHESPRALGFRLHNLAATLNELGPMLLVIALLLLSAGMVLRTLRQTALEDIVFAVATYLPWGLSQQYALNGYFLNRFDAALSDRAASFLAALCLCAAQAPSPYGHHAPAGLGLHAPLPAYPQLVLPSNPRTPRSGCSCSSWCRTPSAAICGSAPLVPTLVAPADVGADRLRLHATLP